MKTTYSQTSTKKIKINGDYFTYRQIGEQQCLPIIMLNHLTGTLDNWDPRVVDGLASEHTVITFNNRGVGSSDGKVPLTVKEMAEDSIAFIQELGYKKVNLLGFSLGGMVAQEIVRLNPSLVHKLILAGTGPAGGVGMDNVTKLTLLDMLHALATFKDPKTYLFFTRSNTGRQSAKAFLSRLKERKKNRDSSISLPAFRRQLKAIHSFALQKPVDLGYITQPTFVANGDNDRMVPTSNSKDLARRIKNSQLEIYKDSGHAGIFQNHEKFIKSALKFLK